MHTPQKSLWQRFQWLWWFAAGSGSGKGRGFLVIWPLVEAITHHFTPTESVPAAPNGLFAVRFTTYQGDPISLPDATTVRKGNRIGELHFQNAAIMVVMDKEGIWGIMRRLDADLKALAAWMQLATLQDVVAFGGVTLLFAIPARKGFLVVERPKTLHAHFERFFMEGLLVLYSKEGIKRMTHGTVTHQFPSEVWISTKHIIQRYGSHMPTPSPAS